MNDRLSQPLQLSPSFSAYAPDRRAALEAKIKQWLARDASTDPGLAELASPESRPAKAYRPRWTLGEAISRAIVPHTGRKIPEAGQ